MQLVNRTLCNIFQEKCSICTGNTKHLTSLSDKVSINELIKTAGMPMGKDMGMFQDYLGKTSSFWGLLSKSLVDVRQKTQAIIVSTDSKFRITGDI